MHKKNSRNRSTCSKETKDPETFILYSPSSIPYSESKPWTKIIFVPLHKKKLHLHKWCNISTWRYTEKKEEQKKQANNHLVFFFFYKIECDFFVNDQCQAWFNGSIQFDWMSNEELNSYFWNEKKIDKHFQLLAVGFKFHLFKYKIFFHLLLNYPHRVMPGFFR